jgi:mono/diheme cytochrome c family protein
VPFAGGLPIGSPLGTIYSTNITPDKETGIGNWSFEDFAKLMRRGEVKSGYVVYPAMPYPSYSRLTDDDLRSLYAYLMKGVPAAHQPNRENGIPWPLSMRWPLKAWRAMFAPDPQAFTPAQGMSAQRARGAYLVEGLGHCGACHTPRSITLQEKALTDREGALFLSGGGSIDGWIAPSLRNEHADGLATWSNQDIVQFLRTGRTERTAAFGAMNDVIVDSMQYMTDDDLNAMAAYLKSLKPNRTDAPQYAYDGRSADQLYHGHPADAGARVYIDRCAACHRSNGTGYGKAFPALAGNPILQTHNPTSAIHIVLSGSAQPGTQMAPSSLAMAPYAKLLSDEEVANVVTFIQTSWGNDGGSATASDVAKMRKNAEPVETQGFRAPMQRDLKRAEPGHSAEPVASGVGNGE